MRRSGFRKQSLEEIQAKQAKKRADKLSAIKEGKTSKKGQNSPQKTRKRVSSPKALKTRLWREFSRYVRYSAANHEGYVHCVSCLKPFHWTEVDAGHYYTNSERNQQFGGNELWYSTENVNPQCRTCNSRHIHKETAKTNYSLFLEEKYGFGILQELYIRKQTPKRFTRDQLEALYQFFKDKVPHDIT